MFLILYKLQYASGHLSEVGNLHARQNDKLLSAIVLLGIGTIGSEFTSAFVCGDTRNASAINVVKSMTVQGMTLFHYQLQDQARTMKKDFKKTQNSILDVIQKRAGNNGPRLRKAIVEGNGDEVMKGLEGVITVLMAGHGFLMEDVIAFWKLLKQADSEESVRALNVYAGYTKSDTQNDIDMFNLTTSLLPMPEAGAFRYLFIKFCVRGIGCAQFKAAITLNCINTEWLRMAVTAINHRGAYEEDQTVYSQLRIVRMMGFKTDTADLQKAVDVIDKEQVVVRFNVALDHADVEKMEKDRGYKLVQDWTIQKYASFFKEEGEAFDGEVNAAKYDPKLLQLPSVVEHKIDENQLRTIDITWIVDRK